MREVVPAIVGQTQILSTAVQLAEYTRLKDRSGAGGTTKEPGLLQLAIDFQRPFALQIEPGSEQIEPGSDTTPRRGSQCLTPRYDSVFTAATGH